MWTRADAAAGPTAGRSAKHVVVYVRRGPTDQTPLGREDEDRSSLAGHRSLLGCPAPGSGRGFTRSPTQPTHTRLPLRALQPCPTLGTNGSERSVPSPVNVRAALAALDTIPTHRHDNFRQSASSTEHPICLVKSAKARRFGEANWLAIALSRRQRGFESRWGYHGETGQLNGLGVSVYLVCRYSWMPSKPPSRPSPDIFQPPNGAAALETTPTLRPIIPVSSRSIIR